MIVNLTYVLSWTLARDNNTVLSTIFKCHMTTLTILWTPIGTNLNTPIETHINNFQAPIIIHLNKLAHEDDVDNGH
jgi:hypothetical protein